MKPTKFDEIVEARTNERAGKKIQDFRDDVLAAACRLLNKSYQYTTYADAGVKKVIGILIGDTPHSGWLPAIWDNEREAVVNALLSSMDEMQKALIASNKIPAGEQDQPDKGE